MSSLVIVDGAEASALPATDSSVLRGDGCFEAIRSYQGRLFALGEHLARLERSASALDLPPPDLERIERWCETMATRLGDGVVRVVMSRGDAIPGGDPTPRYVVVGHPLPTAPAELRLATVEAPWHPAGRTWALAGAKTVSYAPNLSATREAVRRGGHDALLVSVEGTVLEGPTFAVAWVIDGVVETASLDLLVLDSITRRRVVELAHRLGISVREGIFRRDRLDLATEVLALSTVKEVTSVRWLDGTVYHRGPVGRALREAFADSLESELGSFR
jgi:branched-subunit amino acid aminotransferase/4-amino-4-deoxychorismate lyase